MSTRARRTDSWPIIDLQLEIDSGSSLVGPADLLEAAGSSWSDS